MSNPSSSPSSLKIMLFSSFSLAFTGSSAFSGVGDADLDLDGDLKFTFFGVSVGDWLRVRLGEGDFEPDFLEFFELDRDLLASTGDFDLDLDLSFVPNLARRRSKRRSSLESLALSDENLKKI